MNCVVCEYGVDVCVEVVLWDYCDLKGIYDKLVLIEMIEVVGECYMD